MRLRFVFAAMLACILATTATAHAAPAYPAKEIRIINPSGPAGAVDRMARAVQRYLPEIIGVQVLVENRTGAGGKIGINHFLRQPDDGYSLLVFHQPGITDVIKKSGGTMKVEDFAAINIQWSDPALFYAHKNMGWKTFGDFVEAAKKEPNKYVVARPIASAAEAQMIVKLVKDMKLPVKVLALDSGGAVRAAVRGGHAHAGTSGAQGLITEQDIGVGLAYFDTKPSPDWPGVGTLNEQLKPYNYQVPATVGPQRLFAVHRSFKEKNPEGFKKLVEAFRKLTTEHKEFIEFCEKQNIGHDWFGPEKSQEMFLDTYNVYMQTDSEGK